MHILNVFHELPWSVWVFVVIVIVFSGLSLCIFALAYVSVCPCLFVSVWPKGLGGFMVVSAEVKCHWFPVQRAGWTIGSWVVTWCSMMRRWIPHKHISSVEKKPCREEGSVRIPVSLLHFVVTSIVRIYGVFFHWLGLNIALLWLFYETQWWFSEEK